MTILDVYYCCRMREPGLLPTLVELLEHWDQCLPLLLNSLAQIVSYEKLPFMQYRPSLPPLFPGRDQTQHGLSGGGTPARDFRVGPVGVRWALWIVKCRDDLAWLTPPPPPPPPPDVKKHQVVPPGTVLLLVYLLKATSSCFFNSFTFVFYFLHLVLVVWS